MRVSLGTSRLAGIVLRLTAHHTDSTHDNDDGNQGAMGNVDSAGIGPRRAGSAVDLARVAGSAARARVWGGRSQREWHRSRARHGAGVSFSARSAIGVVVGVCSRSARCLSAVNREDNVRQQLQLQENKETGIY